LPKAHPTTPTPTTTHLGFPITPPTDVHSSDIFTGLGAVPL